MIPFTPVTAGFTAAYLLTLALDLTVDGINARHLRRRGAAVPRPFAGTIRPEDLERIGRYTRTNLVFGMLRTGIGKTVFLFLLFSGFLPMLADAVAALDTIPAGLIFFAVPGMILAAADLPFDYYRTFVIEENFGFNTRSMRLWIVDGIKSMGVAVVVFGSLLAGILLLIRHGGSLWWLQAWFFFMGFQLLLTTLYPGLIAPLFNRFSPLPESDLRHRIEGLAQRHGLSLEGIFRMDASRRTRHSNAYFTGLGRSKRIVLFDSLIENHDPEEILAIIAHEIGHLKRDHIKKGLVLIGLAALALFWAAARLLSWDLLFESFGFSGNTPYTGLFLAGVLWGPVGFFLSPVRLALSRRFEREADRFARASMGGAGPMVRALERLARDNLSNLEPHPIYVFLNYSHPPLLERIRRLQAGRETAP